MLSQRVESPDLVSLARRTPRRWVKNEPDKDAPSLHKLMPWESRQQGAARLRVLSGIGQLMARCLGWQGEAQASWTHGIPMFCVIRTARVAWAMMLRSAMAAQSEMHEAMAGTAQLLSMPCSCRRPQRSQASPLEEPRLRQRSPSQRPSSCLWCLASLRLNSSSSSSRGVKSPSLASKALSFLLRSWLTVVSGLRSPAVRIPATPSTKAAECDGSDGRTVSLALCCGTARITRSGSVGFQDCNPTF